MSCSISSSVSPSRTAASTAWRRKREGSGRRSGMSLEPHAGPARSVPDAPAVGQLIEDEEPVAAPALGPLEQRGQEAAAVVVHPEGHGALVAVEVDAPLGVR